MVDDVILHEMFSQDKTKYVKILSNDRIYPNAFKVVMFDASKDSEMFKFTRNLDDAQADATKYVTNS